MKLGPPRTNSWRFSISASRSTSVRGRASSGSDVTVGSPIIFQLLAAGGVPPGFSRPFGYLCVRGGFRAFLETALQRLGDELRDQPVQGAAEASDFFHQARAQV